VRDSTRYLGAGPLRPPKWFLTPFHGSCT